MIDKGVVIPGINDGYAGIAPDLGAFEFTPALSLTGWPDDGAVHLAWEVNATIPLTATWQISHNGPVGDQTLPIITANPTRAYTLTGLTNYTLYIITLSAMLDGSPILTETVAVMPTDLFTFLPLVKRP